MMTNMCRYGVRTWKGRVYLLTFLGILALGPPSYAANPSVALQLQVEAKQAARTPVLLHVVITNTGDTPIQYYNGGPGDYPNAGGLQALITDSKGKSKPMPLSSGQYQTAISYRLELIQPGQSVTSPAVLDPLRVGSYTLQLQGVIGDYPTKAAGISQKVQLTVEDDPILVQKFEQDVLERNRRGDPIAAYLVKQYNLHTVIASLISDLLSDDLTVALHAAITLDFLHRPLQGADPFVRRAMEREVKTVWMVYEGFSEKGDARHEFLMYYLASLASRSRSDEALKSILMLAHSNEDYQTRWHAVGFLNEFRQPQVTEELRGLLKDANERVRAAAALCLAQRSDRAALPVLLELAADKKFPRRTEVFNGLAKFRDDPRVELLFRDVLNDNDTGIRRAATEALTDVSVKDKPGLSTSGTFVVH